MWIQEEMFLKEEENKFIGCSLNDSKEMTSNDKYFGEEGALR